MGITVRAAIDLNQAAEILATKTCEVGVYGDMRVSPLHVRQIASEWLDLTRRDRARRSMLDQLGCVHAFQPVATREDGKVIHICTQCRATRVKRKGRVPTHSKPELAIECFAWSVAIIAAPFLLAAVGSAWTF